MSNAITERLLFELWIGEIICVDSFLKMADSIKEQKMADEKSFSSDFVL